MPWAAMSSGASKHGVGDEAQEVLEVLRTAVDEVTERLRDDAARHARQRGELGVGNGFTPEGEERDASRQAVGAEGIESLGPRASTPEEAHEHAVDAVEVRDAVDRPGLSRADRAEPRRERFERRAQREHLGVDVRDEEDHARSSPTHRSLLSSPRRRSVSSSVGMRLQLSQ